MALIKCPECGKENVSDSAKVCPNCGFQIAEYYQKQRSTDNSLSEDVATKNILESNRKWIVIVSVVVMMIFCLYFFSTRCKHDGCYNKRMSSSDFCSYHQSKIDRLLSYTSGYNDYSSSKTDASTIFGNLSIMNFTASLGKYGGTMTCEVKNNNNFTVNGYFYVNYYDSKENLLYSQLMPLTDVASGEKVSCSTSIPIDNYPSGYDHVGFSQASLTKSR